ncbi:MAG: hypothetical protein NVSMB6_26170 [Burkholderiaceae bacterium]
MLILDSDHLQLVHGHLELPNVPQSYNFLDVDIDVKGESAGHIMSDILRHVPVRQGKWFPTLLSRLQLRGQSELTSGTRTDATVVPPVSPSATSQDWV